MASTSTRMLLLGAVQLFEPVNGYQIRRELVSWRVDEWAHINPGSIYSGLETLARAGHLARHSLVEGNRTVSVYTTTGEGRAEFRQRSRRRCAPTTAARRGGSPRHCPWPRWSLAPTSSRCCGNGSRRSTPCCSRGRPSPRHRPTGCHRTCPRSSRCGNAQGRTERAWLVQMIASLEAGEGSYAGNGPTGPRRPTTPGGPCRPTATATAGPSASEASQGLAVRPREWATICADGGSIALPSGQIERGRADGPDAAGAVT